MTSTVDIGYAKQMQYGNPKARKHAVKRDARGLWVTCCTAKPATREYKGWPTTVNCQACLKELGIKTEDE